MMRSNTYSSSVVMAVVGSLAILLMTVSAAPMQEAEEEQSENMVMGQDEGRDGDVDWDPIDAAALRKLILQLDNDDRRRTTRLQKWNTLTSDLKFGGVGGRVGRAWPQAEPRGWSLRQLRPLDGRLARQWRADKRQVRFRQCYFNPISCFRK